MNYKYLTIKYDLKKFSLKNAELFEIANKYCLYKKKVNIWHLKLIYELTYLLILYIAKAEAKHAKRIN